MADTESPPQPHSARFGARFSPQVLVFVFTLAVASRPLKGAIITGVHWWWGDTYQQVELVMDEARPNEGYPYIDGHLDGSTEVIREFQGRAMGASELDAILASRHSFNEL